jgi:hypothetical protein
MKKAGLSLAVMLAALALSDCATPGNYTWYDVSCCADESALRGMLKDMAKNIADDLNKLQNPAWGMDSAEQLIVSIELEKDFMAGPTAIILRRVTGSRGYEVSIQQQYNGAETAEIQKARIAIETAISKSACPVFNRRIEHSRPEKLG